MTITEEMDPAKEKVRKPDGGAAGKKDGMFSGDNISKETVVPADEQESGKIRTSNRLRQSDVVVAPEDKVAFIDSIVSNTRFEKSYELFGGKLTVRLRSLTSEEVQALAAWTVKSGTTDPTGSIAGRYQKYVFAAHIAMFNGVEMGPLEQPLFSTLESDGKTVKEPGWVERSRFWDEKPLGVTNALEGVIKEFNALYAVLCSKAEDANFWNPDTP